MRRRRHPINVWPALADLMTVLAVPALSTAIGLFPLLGRVSGVGAGHAPQPTQAASAASVDLTPAKSFLEALHQKMGASRIPPPTANLRLQMEVPALEISELNVLCDRLQGAVTKVLHEAVPARTIPFFLEIQPRWREGSRLPDAPQQAHHEGDQAWDLVHKAQRCGSFSWRLNEPAAIATAENRNHHLELWLVPDLSTLAVQEQAPRSTSATP